MKKLLVGAIVMSIIVCVGGAMAAEQGTKEECVALVKQAIDMTKKQGEAAAFKEIMNPNGKFMVKDMYIYVADTTGVCHAHAILPVMVGKNMGNLRDSEGKPFTQELIGLAKKGQKSGWVEYSWTHPKTGKIAHKTAYIESWTNSQGKIYGFVCGVYK